MTLIDRPREEEVELAALDLARRVVGAARLGPGRAVLRHASGVRLEQVRVTETSMTAEKPGWAVGQW